MFKLGSASQRNLDSVDPMLAAVVRRAIQITDVDFSVVEGLRTPERQKQLYADGDSWTLDSKHLVGKAVDIYPWVNGATSHNRNHYDRVALAMQKACAELGVHLIWGGFWQDSQGQTGLDCPHWEMA